MADAITIQVKDAEQVIAHFKAITDTTQARLKIALNKLGAGFVDYVRANKLSGSPLKRRGGALQASFHHTISDTQDTVTASVGSNSPYARYHEYGFHGSESVRAHNRLGHPVRAYSRNVNYPGRPYLRPALDEYRPNIVAAIDAAVKQATT